MRTSKQHNAQPMQQPLIHRQRLCKSVGVQSSQCCIRHFLRLARTSSRLQRQGFIARRVMQACKGKAELQPRTCQHPFFWQHTILPRARFSTQTACTGLAALMGPISPVCSVLLCHRCPCSPFLAGQPLNHSPSHRPSS